MKKDVRKNRVKDIRAYLSAVGAPISQAQGYEVLARASGRVNANTLAGVEEVEKGGVAPSKLFCDRSFEEHEGELSRLCTLYSLNTIEFDHALGSLDIEYGPETVIPLANGRKICCPAYPHDCDYVRVILEGYELMYWNSEEWAEDPACVMGAFLGLARGA